MKVHVIFEHQDGQRSSFPEAGDFGDMTFEEAVREYARELVAQGVLDHDAAHGKKTLFLFREEYETQVTRWIDGEELKELAKT